MAKWIKTDGTTETVEPKNGQYFELDELKYFVGGYIASVWLPEDFKYMIVNEEGIPLQLPFNRYATDMLTLGNNIPQKIVGNVLVVDKEELKK